ncbi:MAG: YceI family protein [Pseudomonadota bacterium]|nr:YceI family protein [Pseudomonadota bacterium]
MKRLAALILAASLSVSSGPVLAAAQEYVMDPDHTQVVFMANHLGFSYVTGQFRAFDGRLILDQDKPENSSVSFNLKTDSVNTGHAGLDKHLRTKDFLNVEQYPTISFVSTRVEQTGPDDAKVEGNLTMLGVTKPVVLQIHHNRTAPHPFSPEKVISGFSATITVRRSDFGMSYGLPAVGDDVLVTVNAEASPAPGK